MAVLDACAEPPRIVHFARCRCAGAAVPAPGERVDRMGVGDQADESFTGR